MPRDFIACVRLAKQGKARVRRVVGPNKAHGLKAGQYRNYCFMSGGKSYAGETHTKKQ